MNLRRATLAGALAAVVASLPLHGSDLPPNTLTDAERAQGWRLLFDGHTTTGWRGFRRDTFPATGWEVADGCLHHRPRGGGGDLVTTETFSSYDFHFEWRIQAEGNSGVKYFITEDRGQAIGHEYQIWAVPNERAQRDRKHATASFYDVLPVGTNAIVHPPGSWNQSRIVVQGPRVEHWLNGERVLAYELGSPAVTQAIRASKFREVSGFGTAFPHRLLLQDHGGEVWFRNLKLRPLEP